jgi:hypothetical protein
MTKDQFKTAAISQGWKPDKYGHLKHVSASGREYRLKLQKLAWRLEQKIRPAPTSYDPKPAPSWVNRRSAYYAKTEASGPALHRVPAPPEPRAPL